MTPIVWTPSRGDFVGSRDGKLDIAMVRHAWGGWWLYGLDDDGELTRQIKPFDSREAAESYAEEHL